MTTLLGQYNTLKASFDSECTSTQQLLDTFKTVENRSYSDQTATDEINAFMDALLEDLYNIPLGSPQNDQLSYQIMRDFSKKSVVFQTAVANRAFIRISEELNESNNKWKGCAWHMWKKQKEPDGIVHAKNIMRSYASLTSEEMIAQKMRKTIGALADKSLRTNQNRKDATIKFYNFCDIVYRAARIDLTTPHTEISTYSGRHRAL